MDQQNLVQSNSEIPERLRKFGDRQLGRAQVLNAADRTGHLVPDPRLDDRCLFLCVGGT
jgi:hypothetical protein